MLNYNPDGKPDIDINAVQRAENFGMRPIHINCDEPGAEVGDPVGVSFIAFVHFVPRAGERILLEDGTVCEVYRVNYKVTDTDGYKSMIPNVDAIRISPER